MQELQLFHIWAAGAVLAGFQIGAFTWRINREVSMGDKGYVTWLTLADGLVGISFLWVVVFVFAMPLKVGVSTGLIAKFLGMGLFLFAAHPVVLAGHYSLYCSWGKNEKKNGGRPRVTKQEIIAFVVSAGLVLGGSWWILR